MDVNQIQQIILQKTYTKSDYIKRVSILREYLETKFFKDGSLGFPRFLETINISENDRETLLVLDEHFFNLFTKDNLYLIINGLTESLKALPILTLYLAVNLDDSQINLLGRWFRQNLNPELIMEIRCNPTLVTGCAYAWNNHYKDLSLHFLLAQKEELINKIIESYVREQI